MVVTQQNHLFLLRCETVQHPANGHLPVPLLHSVQVVLCPLVRYGVLQGEGVSYGMERVACVLANTVQLQDWDGRYSRRNKEWAKTIPNFNSDSVRRDYALNTHPAVLDGFIDLVREEQQRGRAKAGKVQPPRTSMREKLRQEPPARKSAAPKKREPER